jgi:peptide/nickel transport system permease protein
LPASLEIVLVALVVACAIAVPLGVLAAVRQGSWIDQVCRVITTAGVSLPTFFTGLLLAYFFYYLLGWAPSPMGRLDPMFSAPPTVTGFLLIDSLIAREGAVWWAAMKQLSLPVATMAIFVLAPIARMTRASMLGVLGSDFIRTARASGLTPITVLFAYALRNALLPVITTLGMVFGFMLGGSVIVEKVFGWPGIGSYAIDALTASDYAPVQGFVLTMGVLFVFVNLLVDLLYLVVDPRVSVDA